MTTVKKTHWLRNTLIVLVICGLLGTVLAAVLFLSESNQTYAAATIQFSFEGSAEGKAPNGYPFDVNGITTDEVLETALEAAGLMGTYTAEQLRECLNVTGIYPEKIAEQMTKYVSLLDADADMQAALSDYHATQYNIRLYNNFDPDISGKKLTGLLKEIISAYRSVFARTYAVNLEMEDPITGLAEYDYAQQLEAISENVAQKIRYAQELEELAPDFMLNRKDFGDIVVRFQSLQSDADRLNATITLNAVSKDRDRLQKRYEMEIRTQKIQLDSLTEELKQIEEQVKSYEKDGIIYVSANGELSEVGRNASGTYDRLVTKRKQVTDRIAEANRNIALYQGRLDDMLGAAARGKAQAEDEEDATAVEALSTKEYEALKATVEQKIEALTVKKSAIDSDFAAMLDAYTEQKINEKTVSVTAVKYKTPSVFSGGFISRAIKTAGPICAIGFMVCMVLLIISRRKEEKTRKAA